MCRMCKSRLQPLAGALRAWGALAGLQVGFLHLQVAELPMQCGR